jgi:hypothetical protein
VVSFLRFSGAARPDDGAAGDGGAGDGGAADGRGEDGGAADGGAADGAAGPGGSGTGGSVVACVANFAGGPHLTYRIGLPHAGRWREVINTDATAYGGSGVGNLGVIEAIPEPWHGRPASAVIAVPPLGVLWLAPEPSEPGPPPAPAEG